MTKLFITADQVKQLCTSISGTTDNGLISPNIYRAQTIDVLRILGAGLYNKIYADLSTETPLTGDYLFIYNTYLIDLQAYFSAYYFELFNSARSSNQGNKSDDSNSLSEEYKALGVSVETNFREYMETSTITEWTRCSTETNLNGFY